jgi:hypothetical protein
LYDDESGRIGVGRLCLIPLSDEVRLLLARLLSPFWRSLAVLIPQGVLLLLLQAGIQEAVLPLQSHQHGGLLLERRYAHQYGGLLLLPLQDVQHGCLWQPVLQLAGLAPAPALGLRLLGREEKGCRDGNEK